MDIRKLLQFSAIYEQGSILKASEKMYVSQQALSRTLADMERSLGALLFHRSHNTITPTLLGHELYKSCQPLLKENEKLDNHIANFIRQNSGHLIVSIGAAIRYLSTESIWKDFFENFPNLSYEQHESENSKAIEELANDKIDILLSSDYEFSQEYNVIPLMTAERALLVPAMHKLAKHSCIDFSDLKGETMAVSMNKLAYEKFVALCKENNSTPKNIQRLSELLYMYETCNQDNILGITIQKYFTEVYQNIFPNLIEIPFKEPILRYQVSLVYKKGHIKSDIIDKLSLYLKGLIDKKYPMDKET